MAKKSLRNGIFITFEGPEGCGKSTQSRLLFNYLKKHSYPCVHTREPGGTKLGERIRRILLGSNSSAISDLAELFLFEASRAQLIEEAIRENLNKKKVIICDRFSDATFAYQGYGGGVPLKTIKSLDVAATGRIEPDLTILLDIDSVKGLRRARSKGIDRMEKKAIEYHKRVRAGYLELAKSNRNRIKVISADDAIDRIQDSVRREVERVIQRHKRAR